MHGLSYDVRHGGAGVSVSLHVQHFIGAIGWARSGTYRCIRHAGTAPSGAAHAYGMHLQVRNATHRGASVKIRHSRCGRETPVDVRCPHRLLVRRRLTRRAFGALA